MVVRNLMQVTRKVGILYYKSFFLPSIVVYQFSGVHWLASSHICVERVTVMASDAQKQKSSLGLIISLLILLAVGIFVLLPSYNLRTNTSTQTTTENQCPAIGQSFDARQEAFTLAQTAEQYRKIKPFGGNYGLGSYIICFTDGTQQRVQSIPFPGHDNYEDITKPLNYTHSEQSAYGWLQRQLSTLSIDRSNITAFYVVIFSQVRVCDLCPEDMKYWQRTLPRKHKPMRFFSRFGTFRMGKDLFLQIFLRGQEHLLLLAI